jgi:hypothetical protein
LGAVISVCSPDDRYADDMHYMGGCPLTDNLSCPPNPAVVGERWRDDWLKGLDRRVEQDPMPRARMLDLRDPYSSETKDCWVVEPSWPGMDIARTTAPRGSPLAC